MQSCPLFFIRNARYSGATFRVTLVYVGEEACIVTNRRLGGAQPGNRFVSFVRAYARSGCLVELDLKSCGLCFSLFAFGLARSWSFSFVEPGGFGERSLFPFGRRAFPFPFWFRGAFPLPLKRKFTKCIKCKRCIKCIKCVKCIRNM